MSENQPLSVRIAARIRGLCAERNITQAQMAAHLQLSQSAVSGRMRGQTPWSLDELASVCQLLDIEFAVVIDNRLAAVA